MIAASLGKDITDALAVTSVIAVGGIIALTTYMFPTLVAERRCHRQQKAIMVLNIFLGWTFVFWVLALVWAVTTTTNQSTSE